MYSSFQQLRTFSNNSIVKQMRHYLIVRCRLRLKDVVVFIFNDSAHFVCTDEFWSFASDLALVKVPGTIHCLPELHLMETGWHILETVNTI